MAYDYSGCYRCRPVTQCRFCPINPRPTRHWTTRRWPTRPRPGPTYCPFCPNTRPPANNRCPNGGCGSPGIITGGTGNASQDGSGSGNINIVGPVVAG